MKILSTTQMRLMEERGAQMGLTTEVLMENAGKAVAEETKRILGGLEQKNILFLIGPGNNGGDGLVAARYLHDWGATVKIYLLAERPKTDPNLKLVQERGIACIDGIEDVGMTKLAEWLVLAAAVVDAVFGTGLSRRFGGLVTTALGRVNQIKKTQPDTRIIALDVPSGLNADTGAVDQSTPFADFTITLAFPKPGLLKMPGSERVGRIIVVDIGLPDYVLAEPTDEYIGEDWIKTILPERPLQANKGSFGKVLAVAGSINYIGAAYLASSAATRVGAGLVTLAAASGLIPVLAAKMAEVTYLPLRESRSGIISADAVKTLFPRFREYNVLLLGCGLGQDPATVRFIRDTLIGKNRPKRPSTVIDADALNALAGVAGWWAYMPDDAVITPHPGEMARLAGMKVEEVQADREGIAKKMAAKWKKTIVLKGAYTLVASPDERVKISSSANPGLATAGTGDVLAGVIAGLLAQGLSLYDAAVGGVYIHALAGEMVKSRLGDAGMIASDLLPELPLAIKSLKESKKN
jgi:ADP-dependent NAD(P)H-hydrate dehydratase / NAD(P)H-hydrate epimerase